MRGVRPRRTSRSSGDRIRLEWTVPTTYGRAWPASPRAIAARVPTSSARYMWLWTTSGRMSARSVATAPTAMASSGSSITWTGIPRRAILRSALPCESEMSGRLVAVAVHARQERVDVLLGARRSCRSPAAPRRARGVRREPGGGSSA